MAFTSLVTFPLFQLAIFPDPAGNLSSGLAFFDENATANVSGNSSLPNAPELPVLVQYSYSVLFRSLLQLENVIFPGERFNFTVEISSPENGSTFFENGTVVSANFSGENLTIDELEFSANLSGEDAGLNITGSASAPEPGEFEILANISILSPAGTGNFYTISSKVVISAVRELFFSLSAPERAYVGENFSVSAALLNGTDSQSSYLNFSTEPGLTILDGQDANCSGGDCNLTATIVANETGNRTIFVTAFLPDKNLTLDKNRTVLILDRPLEFSAIPPEISETASPGTSYSAEISLLSNRELAVLAEFEGSSANATINETEFNLSAGIPHPVLLAIDIPAEGNYSSSLVFLHQFGNLTIPVLVVAALPENYSVPVPLVISAAINTTEVELGRERVRLQAILENPEAAAYVTFSVIRPDGHEQVLLTKREGAAFLNDYMPTKLGAHAFSNITVWDVSSNLLSYYEPENLTFLSVAPRFAEGSYSVAEISERKEQDVFSGDHRKVIKTLAVQNLLETELYGFSLEGTFELPEDAENVQVKNSDYETVRTETEPLSPGETRTYYLEYEYNFRDRYLKENGIWILPDRKSYDATGGIFSSKIYIRNFREKDFYSEIIPSFDERLELVGAYRIDYEPALFETEVEIFNETCLEEAETESTCIIGTRIENISAMQPVQVPLDILGNYNPEENPLFARIPERDKPPSVFEGGLERRAASVSQELTRDSTTTIKLVFRTSEFGSGEFYVGVTGLEKLDEGSGFSSQKIGEPETLAFGLDPAWTSGPWRMEDGFARGTTGDISHAAVSGNVVNTFSTVDMAPLEGTSGFDDGFEAEFDIADYGTWGDTNSHAAVYLKKDSGNGTANTAPYAIVGIAYYDDQYDDDLDQVTVGFDRDGDGVLEDWDFQIYNLMDDGTTDTSQIRYYSSGSWGSWQNLPSAITSSAEYSTSWEVEFRFPLYNLTQTFDPDWLNTSRIWISFFDADGTSTDRTVNISGTGTDASTWIQFTYNSSNLPPIINLEYAWQVPDNTTAITFETYGAGSATCAATDGAGGFTPNSDWTDAFEDEFSFGTNPIRTGDPWGVSSYPNGAIYLKKNSGAIGASTETVPFLYVCYAMYDDDEDADLDDIRFVFDLNGNDIIDENDTYFRQTMDDGNNDNALIKATYWINGWNASANLGYSMGTIGSATGGTAERWAPSAATGYWNLEGGISFYDIYGAAFSGKDPDQQINKTRISFSTWDRGGSSATDIGNYALTGNFTGKWNNGTYLGTWIGDSLNVVYVSSIDTTAPAITIASPQNQSYFSEWIYANLSSDETLDFCYSSLNGAANTTMANSTANRTTFYYNLSAIVNGLNNISFHCVDRVGNGNVSAVYFTVDRDKPVIYRSSPENVTYTYSDIQFNLSISEPSDWCGVSLNGANNVSITRFNSTQFNSTISLYDGFFGASFSCNDTQSNWNASTANVYFSIDTTEPDVNLCSANKTFLKQGEAARLSCNATDYGNITSPINYTYHKTTTECTSERLVSYSGQSNGPACGYDGSTWSDDDYYRVLSGTAISAFYNFTVPNSSISGISLLSNVWMSSSRQLDIYIYNSTLGDYQNINSVPLGSTATSDYGNCDGQWGSQAACVSSTLCSGPTGCSQIILSGNRIEVGYSISYISGLSFYNDKQAIVMNLTGINASTTFWNSTLVCSETANYTWLSTSAMDSSGNYNLTTGFFPITVKCDVQAPSVNNTAVRNSTNASQSVFFIGDVVRLNFNASDYENGLSYRVISIYDPDSILLVSNASMTAASSQPFQWFYDFNTDSRKNGTYTAYMWANDTSANFNSTSNTFTVNNETFYNMFISTNATDISKTRSFALACNASCNGTVCNSTGAYLQWNNSGSWATVPSSATALTANATIYSCGNIGNTSTCQRTWEVTGNTAGTYYLRCLYNSTSAITNNTATQAETVHVGTLAINISAPYQEPHIINKTDTFLLNISAICYNWYCGIPTISTYLNDSTTLPTTLIGAGTTVKRESGEANPFTCSSALDPLGSGTRTCNQTMTVNMTAVATRLIGANVSSSDGQVSSNVTASNRTVGGKVGTLTLAWIDPLSADIDKISSDTVGTRVTCNSYKCFTATVSVRNATGDSAIPTIATTQPLNITSGTQPQDCGSMNPGNTCDKSWTLFGARSGAETVNFRADSSDPDISSGYSTSSSTTVHVGTLAINISAPYLDPYIVNKTDTFLLNVSAICYSWYCGIPTISTYLNDSTTLPTTLIGAATTVKRESGEANPFTCSSALDPGGSGTRYCNQTMTVNMTAVATRLIGANISSADPDVLSNVTVSNRTVGGKVGTLSFTSVPTTDFLNKTDTRTASYQILCSNYKCFTVSAYLENSTTGGLVPTGETTEKLNISSGTQPQSCGSMNPGNTCDKSWTIFGAHNGTENINGNATSSDSNVAPLDSSQTNYRVFVGTLGISWQDDIIANISKTRMDWVNSTLTCSGFKCFTVDLYLRNTTSNTNIPAGSTTEPLNISSGSQPESCLTMVPGDSCTKSWLLFGAMKGAEDVKVVSVPKDSEVVQVNTTINSTYVRTGWLELLMGAPPTTPNPFMLTVNRTPWTFNMTVVCHDWFCGKPVISALVNDTSANPATIVASDVSTTVKREVGDANPLTCASNLDPNVVGGTANCSLNFTANYTYFGYAHIGGNVTGQDSDVLTNVTYTNRTLKGVLAGLRLNLTHVPNPISKTTNYTQMCSVNCTDASCDETFIFPQYYNGTNWINLPRTLEDPLQANESLYYCGTVLANQVCLKEWSVRGNTFGDYNIRCYANSSTAVPTEETSTSEWHNVTVGTLSVKVISPTSFQDIVINQTVRNFSIVANVTCNNYLCFNVSSYARLNSSGSTMVFAPTSGVSQLFYVDIQPNYSAQNMTVGQSKNVTWWGNATFIGTTLLEVGSNQTDNLTMNYSAQTTFSFINLQTETSANSVNSTQTGSVLGGWGETYRYNITLKDSEYDNATCNLWINKSSSAALINGGSTVVQTNETCSLTYSSFNYSDISGSHYYFFTINDTFHQFNTSAYSGPQIEKDNITAAITAGSFSTVNRSSSQTTTLSIQLNDSDLNTPVPLGTNCTIWATTDQATTWAFANNSTADASGICTIQFNPDCAYSIIATGDHQWKGGTTGNTAYSHFNVTASTVYIRGDMDPLPYIPNSSQLYYQGETFTARGKLYDECGVQQTVVATNVKFYAVNGSNEYDVCGATAYVNPNYQCVMATATLPVATYKLKQNVTDSGYLNRASNTTSFVSFRVQAAYANVSISTNLTSQSYTVNGINQSTGNYSTVQVNLTNTGLGATYDPNSTWQLPPGWSANPATLFYSNISEGGNAQNISTLTVPAGTAPANYIVNITAGWKNPNISLSGTNNSSITIVVSPHPTLDLLDKTIAYTLDHASTAAIGTFRVNSTGNTNISGINFTRNAGTLPGAWLSFNYTNISIIQAAQMNITQISATVPNGTAAGNYFANYTINATGSSCFLSLCWNYLNVTVTVPDNRNWTRVPDTFGNVTVYTNTAGTIGNITSTSRANTEINLTTGVTGNGSALISLSNSSVYLSIQEIENLTVTYSIPYTQPFGEYYANVTLTNSSASPVQQNATLILHVVDNILPNVSSLTFSLTPLDEQFESTNLTANGTDNNAVHSVWFELTLPNTTHENLSATALTALPYSNYYRYSGYVPRLNGTISVRAWINDTSGNLNSSILGSFEAIGYSNFSIISNLTNNKYTVNGITQQTSNYTTVNLTLNNTGFGAGRNSNITFSLPGSWTANPSPLYYGNI
ncbi:MAG: hypothetical protein V1820_04825, partial [archaeon]